MKTVFLSKDNNEETYKDALTSTTMFVYTRAMQSFSSKYVNVFLILSIMSAS